MKARLYTFIIIFIVAAALLGCQKKASTELQGYIEGRFTYIASSVSGHLMTRFVDRGQQVKKGQNLFTLDPQPQEAHWQQATKNLESEEARLLDLQKGSRETILNALRALIEEAKADLALAELTLKRSEGLVKSNAISQAEYDRAYTDYHRKNKVLIKLQADLAEAEQGARDDVITQQIARVEAAKAEVESLRWALLQKTVKAPVSGVIFDTFFRQGEYVGAGQPVLAMLAPKNIYLVFFIPEPSLGAIHVGQQVQFACDGCAKQSATIYFISPHQEYTPPVLFTKEARKKLVYRVEARIPLNEVENFHPGQPVDIFLTKNDS